MRIALTGATGFLGRALLPVLLQRGHQVTALVRQTARMEASAGLSIVQGSLNDEQALLAFSREANVVVHAAGLVAATSRRDFFAVNVDGTARLAKAAVQNGVGRFIHISSLAASQPDLNDYAASKAQAEADLGRMADKLSCVILRPSAIYGPGDTATLPLLKALMSRIAIVPGSAANRFSMVHVEDAARAVVESVESDVTGRFDLSDGKPPHSWPELLRITQSAFCLPHRALYLPRPAAMALGAVGSLLGKLTGKPAVINSGQLRQLYYPEWAVSSRVWPLERAIGLEDGLVSTIRWYQDAGMLPRGPDADRTPPHQPTTA